MSFFIAPSFKRSAKTVARRPHEAGGQPRHAGQVLLRHLDSRRDLEHEDAGREPGRQRKRDDQGGGRLQAQQDGRSAAAFREARTRPHGVTLRR